MAGSGTRLRRALARRCAPLAALADRCASLPPAMRATTLRVLGRDRTAATDGTAALPHQNPARGPTVTGPAIPIQPNPVSGAFPHLRLVRLSERPIRTRRVSSIKPNPASGASAVTGRVVPAWSTLSGSSLGRATGPRLVGLPERAGRTRVSPVEPSPGSGASGVAGCRTGFPHGEAYPILREAAGFRLGLPCIDPRDGTLVAVPDWSSELGLFNAATARCQQIVWGLVTNVGEAKRISGGDTAFRHRVETALRRLDPGLRIGRWGRLQERKEDLDDPTDTYRHGAGLYVLHPGRQIAPLTTAREDGGSGWAPGWSPARNVAFRARPRDGERAFDVLRDQRRPLPPQRQTGVLDLLPALVSSCPTGAAAGLRARGAVSVGMARRAGRAVETRFGPQKTRTGRSIPWEREGGEADTIRFAAQPARSCRLTG
jgi:glycosyl hydrolase family 95